MRSLISTVITSLFLVNYALAGAIYIEGSSGRTYGFNIQGEAPTRDELERAAKYLEQQGDSLPHSIPNFNPVKCPWLGGYYECKKYSLTIFDECIIKKYQSLRGLSHSATVSAKKAIDRQCYEKAANPSILDKLFN